MNTAAAAGAAVRARQASAANTCGTRWKRPGWPIGAGLLPAQGWSCSRGCAGKDTKSGGSGSALLHLVQVVHAQVGQHLRQHALLVALEVAARPGLDGRERVDRVAGAL